MNALSTEERLKICEQCPLYSKARNICNPSLYLNPKTNEVSTSRKEGYIRGCNCYLGIKARNPNNHCVAGKW